MAGVGVVEDGSSSRQRRGREGKVLLACLGTDPGTRQGEGSKLGAALGEYDVNVETDGWVHAKPLIEVNFV